MKRPVFNVLLALAAAAGAAGQSRAQDDKQLALQVRDIFKARCYECHSGDGSASGFAFDVLKVPTLTTKTEDEPAVVVPKEPGKSKLWKAIESDRMPQGKAKMLPPEKAIVKKWIEAGAPNYPVVEQRKFITLEESLTAVRNDLQKAERRDRPFRRYFTLNNKGIPDADLNVYRAALSKAVNSLSWKEAIVQPKPVPGTADTLLAIDVRDLDWDRNNLWFEIMKQYPYGVRYKNNLGQNNELRKVSEDIDDLTRDEQGEICEMPMMRADWFVATATRPPLYYTLLFDAYLPELVARPDDPAAAKTGNPKRMTAYDLEKFLGVDIKANFLNPAPDRIARAGFNKSGVSGQNRLLERHSCRTGAYWKSYDFKADSKRIKLTRFPLGPLNLFPEKQHPYPHQAFIHDGGEVIFNLPNGLQGYLLIKGNDERINDGPVEVVNDATKTSGTTQIVSGVSCMNCHGQGMIPFKDFIREGNALFGKARDAVENLYPKQEKMDELVRRDERKFMAALEEATGSFVKVGADKDKAMKEFREPVGEVARLYRLGYLTLDDVAAEMFEKDAAALRGILGQQEFRLMGLDVLLKPGGVIGRLEWDVIDGMSLMQRVAKALGGNPFNVPR